MDRRGRGCVVGVLALVVLIVWFAIALTIQPGPPTPPIIDAFLWVPRWIAAALGF